MTDPLATPGEPTPPLVSAEVAGQEGPKPDILVPPVKRTGWRNISWPVYAGLSALVLAAVLGIFVSGELGAFLVAAWEVVLFATLCVLAYVGLEAKSARVLSWLLLVMILALGVVMNGLMVYLAMESNSHDLAPEGTVTLAIWIGYLSVVAASLAFLARVSVVRKLATVLTGTTEWTSVRKLALGAATSLTALAIVPLLALGEPPMLMMLDTSPDASSIFDDGRGTAGVLRDQMYSLSWTLVAAMLAVGYGVKRNWPETLARLGLESLSLRQVIGSVLLTGLLLGVAEFLDRGITTTWEFFGWRTTNLEALEVLFGPLISPMGAVVIGITAGLGEEVAVRGILQPRLGILLSNLFFTALHAYQYSWDGLLSVFVIGLALGLIRKRTNTSVSALVHGGYDFVLVMMEAAGT